MKPLAIIGLDPGLTSAYVALDLNGKIIERFSKREMSSSEVIAKLVEVCYPLFIGTDKAKTPSFVDKCATKLGATVISPEQDLRWYEKRDLLEKVNTKSWCAHQQDALAAALLAYGKVKLKIRKVRRYVKIKEIENEFEFMKKALKGNIAFSNIKK